VKKVKTKTIKDKLEKLCSLCGKKIKVIVYTNSLYKGGNYFFDIPISTKKEWARVLKLSTTPSKFGNGIMQVLKEDPKPYKHIEYWECDKCYKAA
jgi:hypothetical protein